MFTAKNVKNYQVIPARDVETEMVGKLHYRIGAESVLCGQDRRNRTPGSTLGMTIISEAVTCKRCLDQMATLPTYKRFMDAMTKAASWSEWSKTLSDQMLSKICSNCSKPIRIIAFEGTNYCSENCRKDLANGSGQSET